MNTITQDYIGDGVYAEFYTDMSIRLWRPSCPFNGDEICLEPEMLEQLVKLHKRALAELREGDPC